MVLWTLTEVDSRHRRQSECGANLVEYALLVALIAVMGVASINAVGTGTSQVFSEYVAAVERGQDALPTAVPEPSQAPTYAGG